MDPEDIMVIEISQTRERQMLYELTYMQNLNKQKTKLIDPENRLLVARGRGGWWMRGIGEGGQNSTNFQL